MRDRPLFPKFSSNSNDPPRLPPQKSNSQKSNSQKSNSQKSNSQASPSQAPSVQQPEQLSSGQPSSGQLSKASAVKVKITRRQQVDMPQKPQNLAQKALSDTVFSDFCENMLLTVDCGEAIPLITRQINHWTSGQPVLTRIICEQVLKVGNKVTQANAISLIDQIVHRDILSNWQKGPAAEHIRAIAAELRSAQNKQLLLLLYLRILQQGSAEAAAGDERDVLLQSGLVVERKKKLKIANLIYAKVFGMAWIEQALPGITRPVNIVRSQTPQRSSSAPSSSKSSSRQRSKPASRQPSAPSSSASSSSASSSSASSSSASFSQRPSQQPAQLPSEQFSQPSTDRQSADRQSADKKPTNKKPVNEKPADEQLAKPSFQLSTEHKLPSEQSQQPTEQPSAISGLYSKVAVFICCLAVLTAAVSAYRSGSKETVLASSVEVNEVGKSQSDQATASLSADESEASEAENRRLFDQGIIHATNGRWLPMVRDFCKISTSSTYFTPAQQQMQQWVKLYKEDIEIAQTTFLAEEASGESSDCSIVSEALAASF